MKKRKISSLVLNKTKISHLAQQKGAGYFTTDQLTVSTCSCVMSCAATCQDSFIVCPPPATETCQTDPQTQNCTQDPNCDTVFCTYIP